MNCPNCQRNLEYVDVVSTARIHQTLNLHAKDYSVYESEHVDFTGDVDVSCPYCDAEFAGDPEDDNWTPTLRAINATG